MHRPVPSQSKRAPAALLALLLGLLFGNAPAFAVADFGEAALSQPRTAKAALAARTIKRDSDEESDPANLPPLSLGTPPNVVTELLSIRPAGEGVAAPAGRTLGSRSSPYRARAPPAA